MIYLPRTLKRISQSRWHNVKAEDSTYDGTEKMLELTVSEIEKAISWLLLGALCFGMRSCEYLKVAPEETKRKIIRVGNVIFKKGNRVIHHNDPDLRSSDLVRIIFVLRNNDKCSICIHMFKSGDTDLCPLISRATTVQRVHMVPESSNESEVCLFYDDRKKTSLLRADHVRSKI